MNRLPFYVSSSGSLLNMPGATQRANQIKPNVQIPGNIGSTASYFDPLAFAPVTTLIGISGCRGEAARTAVRIRRQRIHHEQAMPRNPHAQMVQKSAGIRLAAASAAEIGAVETTVTVNG
jgi:hypothetical protein